MDDVQVQVAECMAVRHGSWYPHVRGHGPPELEAANRSTQFFVCESDSDAEASKEIAEMFKGY